MNLIRINLVHIYRLILIVILLALLCAVYQQVLSIKHKRSSQVVTIELDNADYGTKPTLEPKTDVGQTTVTEDDIKARIKRINLNQAVYNWILGPFNYHSNIIVIQVHSNIFKFKQLLESLKNARGIRNSLLIFSHDYWDEKINKLVRNVRFAKYVQIFYPYSIQLYPNDFPGEDFKLCTESKVCKNSIARNAKAAQGKHHWWWVANQVFDNMAITNNLNEDILFLEEGDYVTPDFLYTYRLLRKVQTSKCEYCEFLSLAAHKYTGPYQYRNVQDTILIEVWTENMQKSGLAFNRETWKAIKSWSKDFCYYNDARWDKSLRNLRNRKWNKNIYVLANHGPRVFRFDKCDGKGDDCKSLADVKKIIASISRELFPTGILIKLKKEEVFNETEPSGGWLDVRDQELCMHFTKQSLWY